MSYRTVTMLEQSRGTLDIPICVPSYSRPDAALLKFAKKEQLPFILFIREEQKNLYKPWAEYCRVVVLKGVTNIGQTRNAILRWAHRQGYDDIFMFDDKVTGVNFMEPHTTRTGNLTLAKSPQCKTLKDALLVWQAFIEEYRPAMSGCQHKGFSYNPANIDKPPLRNGMETKIAIHINVKALFEHGINYRDTKVCGSEDAALLFDVMSSGLSVLTFLDLEYGNVPSGGSSLSVGVSDKEACDRKSRFDAYNRLFLKNVCGEGHPGIGFRKDRGTGVTYIRFKWPYWKSLEALDESPC